MKNFFDFTELRKHYPYFNEVSDDYLTWFIGFFEADGSLIITNKNELNVVISQREDSKYTLDGIANVLKIGKVIVQRKHIVPGKLWMYRWIIRDAKSINVLIRILKGNLVIPYRIHILGKFIETYNSKLLKMKEIRPKKYEDLECISFNPMDKIRVWPTSEDPWFSGYTDGDGCFTVSLLKNSKAFRIGYVLAKKNEEGSLCIISLWNHFAQSLLRTGTVQKAHGDKVIDIRVNGLKNMEKIYPYFDKYPLKTNKYNSYLFTKAMHNYFKEGYHLDETNREKHHEARGNNRKN